MTFSLLWAKRWRQRIYPLNSARHQKYGGFNTRSVTADDKRLRARKLDWLKLWHVLASAKPYLPTTATLSFVGSDTHDASDITAKHSKWKLEVGAPVNSLKRPALSQFVLSTRPKAATHLVCPATPFRLPI